MNLLKCFFKAKFNIVDLLFFAIALSFVNEGAFLLGLVVLVLGIFCSTIVELTFVDKDET